jgi:YidC/Oxa1 family membrane protein insertase
MSYYVGPKDFLNLNRMGEEQDLVMELGFFGAISKILLLMMVGIHRVIPNWGWTIIALTVFIKLLMWPLTSAQVRSAKRMSAIQKPLQELREKHSGNSQKLQSETMRLFKENKVNPAMGCLPLFIQLPIFIGLYVMLRTSSEMRFQKLLWIRDLSVPDTVAHIGSFPINILPLVMGLTMFLQMRLTPTPTADGTQQKILQCMPFIFLFFCYGFPAALVLYWTVQNVLTIVQQLLTQSSIDAEIPTILDGKKRRKRSN